MINEIHWIVKSKDIVTPEEAALMTSRAHPFHTISDYRAYCGKRMNMQSRTEWVSKKAAILDRLVLEVRGKG